MPRPAIHHAILTLLLIAASSSVCLVLLLIFPLSGSVKAIHAAGGDAENGKALFERRCTGCHSLDQDKEGPRLRGVFGRKAGSIATFNYSDSLKASTVVWNEDSLDRWLTDTESVVPDNDMTFHVAKAGERTDIIQYLKAVSGK